MKIEIRWNVADSEVKASDLIADVEGACKIKVMAGLHDGNRTGSIQYLMFETETLDQELPRARLTTVMIISKIQRLLADKGVNTEVWIDNTPLLIYAAMAERSTIRRKTIIKTAADKLKYGTRWFAKSRIKEVLEMLQNEQ